MASQASPPEPHFVLFPFLAQGHMIPMIDTARLLAQHGALVTIVTTPVNAGRFKTVVARAEPRIRVAEVQFPCQEAGLPEGCENFDLLPSTHLIPNFFIAINLMQLPTEKLLEEMAPPPGCIISELCFEWMTDTACKFNVPRIVCHVMSFFSLLCKHNLRINKVYKNITSNSEYFTIPGLPDQIEITKAQLPELMSEELDAYAEKIWAAEMASYGVILNTFDELESRYIEEYKKANRRLKVWCIGPASLCNKDNIDKVERGNKASIDEFECLKWLDSCQPSSVIYVCFGSLCNLTIPQLIELGLGLEASKKPFIWVIRSKELEKWLLEENFDERVKGRGLLIRGWAPQVLILSHPAIGGFLSHCGWNSLLEGISAGVQILTWPLFAEQFCNEKLVVHVLKTGVRIGVEVPILPGEEDESVVLVNKEDVVKALNQFMDEGEERDERRRKARELGKMAKTAIEEGGSSYFNIKSLISMINKHIAYSSVTNLTNVLDIYIYISWKVPRFRFMH
ncbi:hypothetical protein JRO89_XS03G0037000 [Xanthoceras sorbifolium]|uniref:Glycosyltransferase n=1 Tax=Xanthoceras sorbifolium TaxID=99658 RepID=A0ABQ8I8G9_9ROSI|nr:hypothetical protein JRO89_XS03G0037000 [Xanthoceras sorbifolium]